MDTSVEKKWFIYLGDHHEGPFSLDEVETKVTSGTVSPATTFVWAEGMSDWALMAQVTGFEKLVSQQIPNEIREVQESPSQKITIDEKTDNVNLADLQTDKETSPQAMETVDDQFSLGSHRIKTSLIVLVLVLAGVGISLGWMKPLQSIPVVRSFLESAQAYAQPYLLALVERYPALGAWISPIPQLPDVTPEELEELKSSARASLEREGPSVALALSREDLSSPTFYVASNFPDGAQFEIAIEGVPDTLLNQLSFSAGIKTVIARKLGKTEAIRFPDGKPVPRGHYRVTVSGSQDQPARVKAIQGNGKLSLVKSYFLGGPKDDVYASRLKEFHDRLQAKASAELLELKQFAATLENQYAATNSRFNELRRGRVTSAKKRAWGGFHSKWEQLSRQMGTSFSKWTPTMLETEFFYGMIFQLLQQTEQSVERLHQLQQAFFSKEVDPKAFEIQLGEATSQAEHSVTVLKAKIVQAERIPPTPNGMPRKEGL